MIERLRPRFDAEEYGRLDYGPDSYSLMAIRSRDWRDDLPVVLVTGGVHGYETSGVHGALQFVDQHAADYVGRVNLLVAPVRDHALLHIDLHETTDTDETEFRPALAARDGKPFEPGGIPDGFYLVDDSENPQPAFQQALIEAVEQITHIAPADDKGELFGSPVGKGN
ncbi:M14 family metallopeptidase [Marinobacter guineae]|uniref:hypothetical protein n=1 Tax=Marinobacter guineae TaxID=432303 RepID=UPI001D179756|nr:hypothetical protein [Marinobacter guineae]